MTLQNEFTTRSDAPVAVEFGVVTAALAGVYLWHRLMRVVTDPLMEALQSVPALDSLLVVGLATGSLFVGGLVLFVGAYAVTRDISVGLALPSRDDLPLAALAVVTPVLLVGVTKFVGVFTGVSYHTLTNSYYAAETPLTPVLTVVGLGLLVGVPALALICQGLVQESFGRVLDGDSAIVLTTLLTGFVLVSDTGGLTIAPQTGKLAGAALFALAFGVAAYAPRYSDDERLRYLAFVPVLVLVALVIASGITQTESIAEGLFKATQLAVLGIAAYTYDRSGSLLLPALAYLSVSVANDAVVIVLEAGLQSW